MNRRQLVIELEKCLDGRRLVWFGTRGEDAEPLLELANFTDCFSYISPIIDSRLDYSIALEEISCRRKDLDAYKISLDRGAEVMDLRRRILDRLDSSCVLLPYCTEEFVSTFQFAIPNMKYAAPFFEQQSVFDHKPWVETNLQRLGIETIDWRYFSGRADVEQLREREPGAVVVRASRSSGGNGLIQLNEGEVLPEDWEIPADSLISVSPYHSDALSVNLGACVFRGGIVRMHPPSIQLIGTPECTTRPFGYCGNDYGAIKEIDPIFLDCIETVTRKVGQWLHANGYLGAFGADFLVNEERVLLTEINPRFQGSSSAAARLARNANQSNLYLDHLAAYMGIEPLENQPLRVWAEEQESISMVVLHNTAGCDLSVSKKLAAQDLDVARCELVPGYSVQIEPDSTICRLVFDRSVSCKGRELDQGCRTVIKTASEHFSEIEGPHDLSAMSLAG